MEVLPTYRAAWADYRRRRNLLIGSFIAFLPGTILVGVPLGTAVGSDIPVTAAGFLILALIAVSSVRLSAWRSPRCRNRYFVKAFVRNPLASRCLHCGLPKWTIPNPAPRRPDISPAVNPLARPPYQS